MLDTKLKRLIDAKINTTYINKPHKLRLQKASVNKLKDW